VRGGVPVDDALFEHGLEGGADGLDAVDSVCLLQTTVGFLVEELTERWVTLRRLPPEQNSWMM
jgi:hypothetical protein